MDTAVAERTDTDAELVAAYRELRALTAVQVEGWAEYLAGLPAKGEHYLDVADPHGGHRRGLIRGEGFEWARGLAQGWGHPDVVTDVLTEPVPDVCDIDEAARQLGISVAGVRYRIAAGLLYPIYAGHRLRVFTAQIDAARDASDRPAVAAWEALHLSLPPAVKPSALSLSMAPSPDPLPVRGRSLDHRCRTLLGIAHAQGWLIYHHPVPGGYDIEVLEPPPGRGRHPETIAPAAVAPRVLGIADARGLAHLVAYRPGLG